SELPHVSRVRVGGPGAFDLVNRVTPLELYARDGQMLHTLLLESSAQVLADVYVCRDDEQYLLLAEGPDGPTLRDWVRELGKDFGLADLDFASLEQAMLEAFTFNIRREGRAGATPLELQLQWGVSYEKDSIAAAALKAHRTQGAKERLTFVRSPERVAAGDAVTLGEERIGT